MSARHETDLEAIAIGLSIAMREGRHGDAQLAIDVIRAIIDRHQSAIILARVREMAGCGPALTAEQVREVERRILDSHAARPVGDAVADLMHDVVRGPHGGAS